MQKTWIKGRKLCMPTTQKELFDTVLYLTNILFISILA